MTPLDWFKKEKPLMGLLGTGGGLGQGGVKEPLPFAIRYFITAGGGGGGGGQGAGGGGAGAGGVMLSDAVKNGPGFSGGRKGAVK